MGMNLVNVFVRSDDQAAVVQAAKEALRPFYAPDPTDHVGEISALFGLSNEETNTFRQMWADAAHRMAADEFHRAFYVSPSLNGWISVHDSKMHALSSAPERCPAVAVGLSQALHTTAIAFAIFDNSVFRYWLARDGQLLDEYDSIPGYFDPIPDDADDDWQPGGPSGGDAVALAEACGVPAKAADVAALLAKPDGNGFPLLTRLGEALAIPGPTVDFDEVRHAPPEGFVSVDHKEMMD